MDTQHQETVAILNEVTRIFREEDDIAAAKRVVQARMASEKICAEKETKMKAQIQG